ncbi:GPO family capsid scaffolding protein, partial [Herbaspirillum sp. B65]|uniref:GPO family capsid scaffolding protein n=1 Tax=Herbaspirillum sp. B65 TaxID=137708 RepID=UPI001902BBB6
AEALGLDNLHDQMREGTTDKRYFTLVQGDWKNARQHVKLPLFKYSKLFSRIGGGEKKADAQHADVVAAMTAVAEKVGEFAQATAQTGKDVAEAVARLEKLEKRVGDESTTAEQFRQTVNLTDKSNVQRPPATGGGSSGAALTEF